MTASKRATERSTRRPWTAGEVVHVKTKICHGVNAGSHHAVADAEHGERVAGDAEWCARAAAALA